jgi:hypothetical protein
MTAASWVILSALLGQARTTDTTPPAPRFVPKITGATRMDDERPDAPPSRSPTRFTEETEPVDTRAGRSLRGNASDAAPARELDSRFSRESDDTSRLAPVNRFNQKMSPPSIIADALSTVPEGAFAPLEGEPSQYQPLLLVDALKRSNDRAQQIRITQAYWRLAIAQADYHFARVAVAQLRDATEGQLKQPALRAARCAMRALQRDAEVLVIRAQIRLAEEMRMNPGSVMPLAVDIPLTATYDTKFELVFANRTPPARAYAINRTMPIRQQAIEEHSLGIQEAMDAVDASIEEYAAKTADLTTLIVAFERLWKERKAFTAAVYDYNWDIAEYALPINSTTDPNKLVAMLVTPGARGTGSGLNGSGTNPPQRPNPAKSSGPIDDEPPADRYQDRRYDRSIPDDADVPPARNRSTDVRTPTSNRRTSYYQSPPSRNMDFDPAHAQLSLYSGLVDVDTPLRTQRLAANLHDVARLPRDTGQLVSLLDCLSKCPVEARRDVIAAYWGAKEAATTYQVLADEETELTDLAQDAKNLTRAAGGPEAAVRLRALRRSVKAAMLDAQYELSLAQFTLTTLCHGRLDGEWLLPSTPPHGGRYLLKLEDQPQQVIDSNGLIQRGAIVKVLHEQMEDHAGTVVYADLARATAMGQRGAGPEALNAAMVFVERQTSHTVFFLRATTKYNLAIADYVMSVTPQNVPAEELVSKLVLTRTRSVRT